MARKKIAQVLVTAFVAAGALAIAAPAFAGNVGSYLRRDLSSGTAPTLLYVNDYIQRSSGSTYYWLILQSDGNLVLYKGNASHVATKACWWSGTQGQSSGRAVYQSDGNFVIYHTNNYALWGSNTYGGSGTTVDINASGRLYVGNTPISSAC